MLIFLCVEPAYGPRVIQRWCRRVQQEDSGGEGVRTRLGTGLRGGTHGCLASPSPQGTVGTEENAGESHLPLIRPEIRRLLMTVAKSLDPKWPHKTWGLIWNPNCLTLRLYISYNLEENLVLTHFKNKLKNKYSRHAALSTKSLRQNIFKITWSFIHQTLYLFIKLV